MLRLRMVRFSAASRSRKPMYTMSSGFRHGLNQWNDGSLWASLASPRRNPSGIPCIFPLKDTSGVLISACASTQTTPVLGLAWHIAGSVPIGIQWSPPSMRRNLFKSTACLSTSLKADSLTRPTSAQFFAFSPHSELSTDPVDFISGTWWIL